MINEESLPWLMTTLTILAMWVTVSTIVQVRNWVSIRRLKHDNSQLQHLIAREILLQEEVYELREKPHSSDPSEITEPAVTEVTVEEVQTASTQ